MRKQIARYVHGRFFLLRSQQHNQPGRQTDLQACFQREYDCFCSYAVGSIRDESMAQLQIWTLYCVNARPRFHTCNAFAETLHGNDWKLSCRKSNVRADEMQQSADWGKSRQSSNIHERRMVQADRSEIAQLKRELRQVLIAPFALVHIISTFIEARRSASKLGLHGLHGEILGLTRAGYQQAQAKDLKTGDGARGRGGRQSQTAVSSPAKAGNRWRLEGCARQWARWAV